MAVLFTFRLFRRLVARSAVERTILPNVDNQALISAATYFATGKAQLNNPNLTFSIMFCYFENRMYIPGNTELTKREVLTFLVILTGVIGIGYLALTHLAVLAQYRNWAIGLIVVAALGFFICTAAEDTGDYFQNWKAKIKTGFIILGVWALLFLLAGLIIRG